jgi:hypothetical protein
MRDRVYQLIVIGEGEKGWGSEPALASWGPLYNSVSWEKISSRPHSEVLDALLLDVGLLDLVWEPSRAASRLVDHRDVAREDVDTLGATLS